VFAVAVAIWADRVARDQTLASYLQSSGYLLPIWWVWLGQAVFATRFPADSTAARVLALIQVVGVGVMSTQLLEEDATSARFALGFVAARAALLISYVPVQRSTPDARSVANVYLVGFGAGAAIWAASLGLPAGMRPAAWALGMAVDLATPWLGRPALQRIPLDHSRLPSRMGVFTSLLLYVSVEGIVRGLAEKGWTAWTVTVALLSFLLVVSLWWVYARVNRADMRIGAGQPYLYSHFLIVLGVGTSSIGIRRFAEADSGEEAIHALPLLAGGIVLWLVGLLLIRGLVLHHRDRYWFGPFLAAALVIPLLARVGSWSPIGTLAIFVAVTLALLAIELRHGAKHEGPRHRL
jgi:low temperature requirement protein LtrA